MYGSSECYFGINLRSLCDPSEMSYVIMPNMAYFEFLPTTGGGRDESRLVELANWEQARGPLALQPHLALPHRPSLPQLTPHAWLPESALAHARRAAEAGAGLSYARAMGCR
jgi:hypothetical protein